MGRSPKRCWRRISIDLHADVFRPNFFGLTDLHHTPIIYRSGYDRYKLYVPRTFALWTWEWLIDAALPFGYEIEEREICLEVAPES